MKLADYTTLDNLANWLRTEPTARGTDPRNIAWADHAASQVEALLAANRLLIEQYQAQDNFTMGGALTNEPFLAIEKVLRDDD
jgi:hypothetical protein